jgi:hypothetical protein
MAYATRSLIRTVQAPIGAADGKSSAGSPVSHYIYATDDAVATVETSAYFKDSRLRKGDLIDVAAVVGGTPVRKAYVVTAVNADNEATIVSAYAEPA